MNVMLEINFKKKVKFFGGTLVLGGKKLPHRTVMVPEPLPY
jgi:hypothetical protein